VKRRKTTRIAALGIALAALLATWALRPREFGLEIIPARHAFYEPMNSTPPDSRLTFSPAFGKRRIYPYSVIPGGIQSLESLKSTIEHNPDIARHLKDFDLEHAKVVQVAEPRAVYVSYRMGSNLFWTTKRLMLAKGESLITDGTRTLRGRCGNDVSEVAVEPTDDEEPPIDELDTPLALPQVAADAQPDPAPLPLLAYVPPDDTSIGAPTFFVPPFGLPAGSTSTPPTGAGSPPQGPSPPPFIVPPFGPPASFVPNPSTPPVSTPEPSTLLLVLFGAAGVGVRRVWGKRK
jgi:hypothetical protein